MKLRGLVPNSYIHVGMRDLFIPRIVLPIRLQQIGILILGIYKSLTDTCMLKLGHRTYFIGFTPALHWQCGKAAYSTIGQRTARERT
jgi:hypothetical protein